MRIRVTLLSPSVQLLPCPKWQIDSSLLLFPPQYMNSVIEYMIIIMEYAQFASREQINNKFFIHYDTVITRSHVFRVK